MSMLPEIRSGLLGKVATLMFPYAADVQTLLLASRAHWAVAASYMSTKTIRKPTLAGAFSKNSVILCNGLR